MINSYTDNLNFWIKLYCARTVALNIKRSTDIPFTKTSSDISISETKHNKVNTYSLKSVIQC